MRFNRLIRDVALQRFSVGGVPLADMGYTEHNARKNGHDTDSVKSHAARCKSRNATKPQNPKSKESAQKL